MVIGIKDLFKLAAISVVIGCAVFVCTLFLSYNRDILLIRDQLSEGPALIMYEAQIASGRMVAAVTGGCLVITSAIMLIFYIKNYIDSHGKELGILKALGYSNLQIAAHFVLFGVSVLLGGLLGYGAAMAYMPSFYATQNNEHLFPELTVHAYLSLPVVLILLPTVLFSLLAVLYAALRLQRPPLALLKDLSTARSAPRGADTPSLPFLAELRRNTLRTRKILTFFVGFSSFCFSAMTQMSMSMKQLASDTFAWMILAIGLILAFTTLLMSLTSVMRANTKTIAMMRVFGYSRRDCRRALLDGYRPVSYIGFALGSVYQYLLLKIAVTVIFADVANMPAYGFDFQALLLSALLFLPVYELILFGCSRRIRRLSVKEIMSE